MVENQQAVQPASTDIAFLERELTFDEFLAIYKDNISIRNCLPEFFGDLCRGWTQQTLRENHMGMTKRGTVPLKLWYESVLDMRSISNKRQACKDLFEWLDYKKLGRICTLELFAVMVFSLDGTKEIIAQNIMLFFGFQNENEFQRGELHFFFDCLFRGLCNLTTLQNEKLPSHRGFAVNQDDIAKLVDQIFPQKKESVDRQ